MSLSQWKCALIALILVSGAPSHSHGLEQVPKSKLNEILAPIMACLHLREIVSSTGSTWGKTGTSGWRKTGAGGELGGQQNELYIDSPSPIEMVVELDIQALIRSYDFAFYQGVGGEYAIAFRWHNYLVAIENPEAPWERCRVENGILTYLYLQAGQIDDRRERLWCKIRSEDGKQESRVGLLVAEDALDRRVVPSTTLCQEVQSQIDKIRREVQAPSSQFSLKCQENGATMEWMYYTKGLGKAPHGTLSAITLLDPLPLELGSAFGGVYYGPVESIRHADIEKYRDGAILRCASVIQGRGRYYLPFFFGKIGTCYFCFPLEGADFLVNLGPKDGIKFHASIQSNWP